GRPPTNENRYRAARRLLIRAMFRVSDARSNLAARFAAFDFGDELGRAGGQLFHGAVEGGAVAGRDYFGEAIHERERAGGKLLVDLAAGRRLRLKRLPQVRTIGASAEKSALIELRHSARDLGLVHMGVGADGLAGHD